MYRSKRSASADEYVVKHIEFFFGFSACCFVPVTSDLIGITVHSGLKWTQRPPYLHALEQTLLLAVVSFWFHDIVICLPP